MQAYSSRLQRWATFCSHHHIHRVDGMTTSNVVAFLLTLAREGLQASTLRQYVTALNQLRSLIGLPSLTSVHGNAISLFCDSIERAPVAPPARPRTAERLPVTISILAIISRRVSMDTIDGQMIWAAMTMAVCGLLRSGEFTVRASHSPDDQHRALLRMQHLSLSTDRSGMSLRIPVSKTDPLGRGVTVSYACIPNVPWCPVCSVRDYLSARQRLSSSPVSTNDALFVQPNGLPLTQQYLIERLQSMITLVPELRSHASRFTGHSFRRGGAQSLADAGVPINDIMIAGRWRSNAVNVYLSTSASMAIVQAAAFAGSLTRAANAPLVPSNPLMISIDDDDID